jgi:uncharacterized damage-inducible protein DinB
MSLQRPKSGEYNPYFSHYLSLVPEDGSFEELFHKATNDLIHLLANIPMGKADYAYAEGKWSVKQVVQHLSDSDRVFSYRALIAARGDLKTQLFSMDENMYALNADVSMRSLPEMLEELEAVRKSFFKLLQHMNDEHASRLAYVENHPLTARAMGYISIGHCMHHLSVLHSRYFPTEQ